MPGGSEKEAHDYDTHDFSLQNYKASTHCKKKMNLHFLASLVTSFF